MHKQTKNISVAGMRVDFDLLKGYDKDTGQLIYHIHQGGQRIAKANLPYDTDAIYEVWYDGPTRRGEYVSIEVPGEKPMKNITSVLRQVAEVWGKTDGE